LVTVGVMMEYWVKCRKIEHTGIIEKKSIVEGI